MGADGAREQYGRSISMEGRSNTPEESRAAFVAMLAVAEKGYLPAMTHVAMTYDDGGWYGEDAVLWLRRAAAAGDPDSAWRLAAYYPEELEPGQDPDEVMLEAARAGGPEAIEDAAGRAVRAGDSQTLEAWLEIALERGGPALALQVLRAVSMRPGSLHLFERVIAEAADDEDVRRRAYGSLISWFHLSGCTALVPDWLGEALPRMTARDTATISGMLPFEFARTCLERLVGNAEHITPTSERTWHEVATQALQRRADEEGTGTAGW